MTVRDYEITVHAGRHKTGTSAIQAFLAHNEKVLLDKFGILYPKTGRDRWKPYHHPVFSDVIAHDRGMESSLVESVLQEALQAGARRILLSSEMLSRPSVSCDQLSRIAKSFSGFSTKIIIYLRRQDTFLQSTYANRIRMGLLAAPDTIHDINADLDYLSFLNRFSTAFGSDSLLVRSYDDAVKKSLIEDFLGLLGVPLGACFETLDDRVNTRLPWRYIDILRRGNRYPWIRAVLTGPRIHLLVAWLYHRYPEWMDRPRPLNENECAMLLRDFAKSNQEVARTYMNHDYLFDTDIH